MARIEGVVTPTHPSERRLPLNGGLITPTTETSGATVPSRPKFSSTQSDGSHIVVASPHPSGRRSLGRVAVVASVIAGGLTASLLAVLVAGRHAKAPTATVPLATPTSQGEPSDLAPLPALTASGAASLDPPALTNARNVAPTGEQGEASTKPAPLQAHPPGKPTRRDCDPPFTIDQKGHKHYKAACL